MGRPPLVALFFRADGYQVSWAPLDTMDLVARSAWYPAGNPGVATVPDLAPLRARAISRGGAFYLTLGGYF